MAEKISAVYKITNTVTGDFYIGSSKNIKSRWKDHKKPSVWNKNPNNPMYQDMMKYSVNKFEFQILAEVESEYLKETEQQFIETLKPTYNNRRANGWDIERYKEYEKTDKRKKAKKEYCSQLCYYNNETLTLSALRYRFMRKGLSNPTTEAKKYLLNKPKDNIKENKLCQSENTEPHIKEVNQKSQMRSFHCYQLENILLTLFQVEAH